MADLREDLLAARYRMESVLAALKENDSEAAERHLLETHRAIEVAGRVKPTALRRPDDRPGAYEGGSNGWVSSWASLIHKTALQGEKTGSLVPTIV